MMFIVHSEKHREMEPPAALYEAMGKFVTESMKTGFLLDTAGLKPTAKAKRVRLEGRKITVTDGPFTEAKEVVGGYALVEATSDAHALEIAKQFMELHRVHWPEFVGEAQLRPLEDMEPPK
jgi:hypothetical protein